MALILPSSVSLKTIEEGMLMGWTLFSIFLLMEPTLDLILTSSSTSLDMVETIDGIELVLVEFCLTFSSTWREMVEMLDWMEFSLGMTLLGRTPSSFLWAMFFCSYVPSIFYKKREYDSLSFVKRCLDTMQCRHNLFNWFYSDWKRANGKSKKVAHINKSFEAELLINHIHLIFFLSPILEKMFLQVKFFVQARILH